MIKVGIVGAETKLAGEIIRILINHPETDLTYLYSPLLIGRSVSSYHHGLIGEDNFTFTDKINLEDLDYLILLQTDEVAKEIIKNSKDHEGLKMATLDKYNYILPDNEDWERGLSEINRKALVRGASFAEIPSPIIAPALIALYPLALFMLLNSNIEVEEFVPEDISLEYDENKEARKIESFLQNKQPSFKGKVSVKIRTDHATERSSHMRIRLETPVTLEEIEKIYDQIYDDHNFTFLTRSESSINEVEGTQKVVIYLKKSDSEKLEIDIFSDARMRGGAGDIVHVMNLFFGLHEKTGLQLKSSKY